MSGAFRCVALVLLGVLALPAAARSEDGYELWLRYPQVSNAARLAEYRAALAGLFVAGGSPTAGAARDELTRGAKERIAKLDGDLRASGVDLVLVDAAGSVIDPLLRFFRERQRRLRR